MLVIGFIAGIVLCWRLARSHVFYERIVIALVLGPSLFAYLGGTFVLFFGGLGLDATALLALVAMLGAVLAERWYTTAQTSNSATEPPSLGMHLGFAAVLLVGLWIAMQGLLYPTTWHDPLTIEIFASRLAESADFWSLPRSSPDERGYFYPLTHNVGPLLHVSFVQQILGPELSSFAYTTRVMAGYYAALMLLAVYLLVAHKSRTAAWLSVALMCLAPRVHSILISSNQDAPRLALLMVATLVLARMHMLDVRATLLVAISISLAASWHNANLVIMPVALGALLILPNGNGGQLTRRVLRALGLILFIAAPPFLATAVHERNVLISQSTSKLAAGERHPGAELVTSLKSTYATAGLRGEGLSLRLANLIDSKSVGAMGFLLLLSIVAGVCFIEVRTLDRRRLLFWGGICCMSIVLVADPYDVMLRLTRKEYHSNFRYAMTFLPWLAVVLGLTVAFLETRLSRVVMIPMLWFAFVSAGGTGHKIFAMDAKLPQKDNICLTCDDRTKLRHSTEATSFVALEWLTATVDDARCLTFRDAEYFYWTQRPGIIYYDDRVQAIFALTDADAILRSLRALHINCVLIPYSSMYTNFSKISPGFFSITNFDNVLALEINGNQIWLLDFELVEPAGSAESVRRYSLDQIPMGKDPKVEVADLERRYQVKPARRGQPLLDTLLVPVFGGEATASVQAMELLTYRAFSLQQRE